MGGKQSTEASGWLFPNKRKGLLCKTQQPVQWKAWRDSKQKARDNYTTQSYPPDSVKRHKGFAWRQIPSCRSRDQYFVFKLTEDNFCAGPQN